MTSRRFHAPSGAIIPFTVLGQGTAPLGNLYRALPEDQVQNTLQAAWDGGVRYFDTAPLYGFGLAETRLNHFLRDKPRDRYVISTKVGRRLALTAPKDRSGIGKFFDTPSRREVFDYSYDGVMRSVEDSLERLGLDRIDMLFVHDLDVFTHGSTLARDAHVEAFMRGGYGALVKLREGKAIKAFGAGVNEWQVCQHLAERGEFDLFLLAGRYTLLEQDPLESFLPLCESRGIGIVIGGPFNSGILASGAKPGAWYNYSPAPPEILERVRRLEQVCRAHRVSLVEAALRFPMGHPAVVTVVAGATSPAEVARNIRTLAAGMPHAFWKDLKAEGLVRSDAKV